MLYCGLRKPEPAYQGKTAAEWFQEFKNASSRHWVPVPFPTIYSKGDRMLDSSALYREEAAEGLRALGTNAALYLGTRFGKNAGTLSYRYASLYSRLPNFLRRRLPRPTAGMELVEINWALGALGRDASAAAPYMIPALRSAGCFGATVEALKQLEFDRHQLDPLLEEWSRNGQHTNVVRVVRDLRVRTSVAGQCLARALRGQDNGFRRICLSELDLLGSAALPAVPELIAALKDEDEQVRYGAARALEAVGPEAGRAVPALQQATNDSSIMVQRASARALRVIEKKGTE